MPGNDNFAAITGTLYGTDRDTASSLSYSIQNGVAENNTIGSVNYDQKRIGSFGTLYLNSSTGAYTFVPDDAAIEGQTASSLSEDNFVFLVSDGTASTTTGFTAWIVGAGDAPIISDGNDRVTLSEANTALSATGNITVTDSDLSDAVNIGKSLTVGGTSTATHPSNADLLAMLSLTPSSLLSDASSTSASVGWAFNSGTQHFNYLAAGETLVLTYTVSATDTGSPALSDNTTVTITITGTNDGPTLTAPATVALSDTSADDTFANVSGTLAGSDVDHNAVLSYSVAGQTNGSQSIGGVTYTASLVGRYGTLYLNGSTGAYVYVPDDAAIEALQANTSEAFSVRVSDGTSSATQTLQVAITATNDTPALTASVTSMAYTDTAADNSFTAITGSLSHVDRDGDAVTYSVAGQVSEVNQISSVRYDVKRVGTYGTLYLNSNSGAYVFVPGDAAIEGIKTNSSETFSLLASDGNAVDAVQLAINLTGSNDTPTLSASVTAIALTDTADNDVFTSVSGTLSSADRDRNDSATYSATGDTADTSRTGYDRKLAGTYGALYLNLSLIHI